MTRAAGQTDRPSTRPGGPESLVGVVLGGRYRIERLIGEGGMGAVYQAEHTHMRKRLAVKVLHPEMGRLAEVVARFEREAMAAAHIDHPNVAGATDFGKLDDGSFFLVLEYVVGTGLREALGKGRFELGRAIHVVRQIASALARAHTLGIVHRDLKPENIMLVERDRDPDFVKVLDFGIAKVPVGDLLGEQQPGSGQALTQLGMVYGTPEYMAPEQALGQPVDARADLYALGAMAFEMITGSRPYNHESKVTLLGMHVTAPIPRMAERAPDANVPPEMDAIVGKLLAKEAASRFADARELIEALDTTAAQLASAGRIADPAVPMSVVQQPPRASSPRLAPGSIASPSALALSPTYLAEHGAGRSFQRLGGQIVGRARAAFDAAPPWAKSRKAALVAASVGAGALVLALVSTSLESPRPAVSAAAGASESAAPPPPHPPDVKVDAVVGSAQANIERGDFADAIDALTGVEKKGPDRSDVHLLLERAYTAVHNAKDALHEAGLLLTVDPNGAADLKLQEDVRNAALLRGETQDDAFALLESKMGPRGIDILYDMAYGASGRLYPQAASRAKHSLELAEVKARASPALLVLLDFRDAKTCEDRHALLERARDYGDVRMLSALQSYESTRGCGFLSRSDCYPCMHRDHLLGEAIATITERSARAAQ